MAISDKINSIKQHVGNAYTAIQGKNGTIPAKKNIQNLASAVESIDTSKPEETKRVALNMALGNQSVVPAAGKVLTEVIVEKPSTLIAGNIKKDINIGGVVGSLAFKPNLQSKSATPTKSQQSVKSDSGYDGLSEVIVNAIPSSYVIPSGSVDITANGTHNVSGKASVNVNVSAQLKLQQKTITPTKSKQTVKSDSSYDGLSEVIVNAIPDEYISPSGSLNITENGTYDIKAKANVVVNVESEKPTLNAPTVSLSNSTLTITNPATNGNFVTSYRIFNGSAELAVVTSKTVDLSTLLTDSGTYSITVKASAPNFNNSAASNAVSYEVAAAGYNVTFAGWTVSTDYGAFVRVYDAQSATGNYTSLPSSGGTVNCTSGYLYLEGNYGDTDYNDSSIDTPTVAGGVTIESIDQTSMGNSWILFKVTGDGTVGSFYMSCFIEGTQIALADGTTKAIEDITYDDELLVWNFYDGKFDTAKPTWIKVEETAPRYNLVKFSDGREFGTVGAGGEKGYHRVFSKEAGAFTHIGTDTTPIGTTTFADDGTNPTIVSEEIIEKPVKYYNIITDKHYNIFANGILTSCRLSNKYHIEDMKYIGEPVIHKQEEKEYRERLEKNRKWLG